MHITIAVQYLFFNKKKNNMFLMKLRKKLSYRIVEILKKIKMEKSGKKCLVNGQLL